MNLFSAQNECDSEAGPPTNPLLISQLDCQPARSRHQAAEPQGPLSNGRRHTPAYAFLFLYDLWLQARDKGYHLAALRLGYLELIKRRREIADERRIVGLGDSHSRMRGLRVPPQVEGRPPGGGGDEIDCELALPPVCVRTAGASPEPSQQLVVA